MPDRQRSKPGIRLCVSSSALSVMHKLCEGCRSALSSLYQHVAMHSQAQLVLPAGSAKFRPKPVCVHVGFMYCHLRRHCLEASEQVMG